MKNFVALALSVMVCGCGGEASDTKTKDKVEVVDLERTREATKAKSMVEIARQTAHLPKEIESASCSEDKRTGIHTCEYQLKENPDQKLKATIVQCDLAFYFDKCPDNLGI